MERTCGLVGCFLAFPLLLPGDNVLFALLVPKWRVRKPTTIELENRIAKAEPQWCAIAHFQLGHARATIGK